MENQEGAARRAPDRSVRTAAPARRPPLPRLLAVDVVNVGKTALGIGFGPVLARWQPGETEYRLSAVPLGGYVVYLGETPEECGHRIVEFLTVLTRADEAGVRSGDRVLAVDGTAVATPTAALDAHVATAAETTRWTVERDGAPVTLAVPPGNGFTEDDVVGGPVARARLTPPETRPPTSWPPECLSASRTSDSAA